MFDFLTKGLAPGYRLRVTLPDDIAKRIGPGRRTAKVTLEETGAGGARLIVEPKSGRVSKLTMDLPADD